MRAKAYASSLKIRVGDARWLSRREGILRRKYGIGNAEFDMMAAMQKGCCALCGRKPVARRKHTPTGREWTSLHIDHDHSTGRIRGLLCVTCNTGVGWLEGLVTNSDVVAYMLDADPLAEVVGKDPASVG
jgi:hypothetical protein